MVLVSVMVMVMNMVIAFPPKQSSQFYILTQ